MKKLLLLLASGSIALSGYAQYRTVGLAPTERGRTYKTPDVAAMLKSKNDGSVAHKTTAAGERWYSFWGYNDAMLTATVGYQMNNFALPIWSDTVHKINYSTGAQHINMATVGAVLDPSAVSFNDPDYYDGEMKVGPTDAYVVDSITLLGVYSASSATTSVVDTIRLSFLTGMGGAASSDDIFGGGLAGGGHYGAATFVSMRHDSLLMTARSGTVPVGSPSTHVMDILLTSADYADTNANGIWIKTVPVMMVGSTHTPLSVPANGMAGMSLTFFSGESATTNPAETVVYDAVTNTTSHNLFRPLVGYAANSSDEIQWLPGYFAPDPKADSNTGLFKRFPGTNGWAGQFLPNWAFFTNGTSGTEPSSLQVPNFLFHITCPTCGTVTSGGTSGVANANPVKKINAFPNPAGDVLNVPFTLATATDVTVTLTNVLGQVVASQEMGNVATGTAKFNTISLPAGVYTYSVLANGQRSTGRVAIAH